jgi:4-alpha-glucanotransferase
MPKVQFIFAIHNHQPVGNFDFVAENAYQKSYLPFINVLEHHPKIKIVLHYTGILYRYFEKHHPEFLDKIGRLAAAGQAEILSGGFYEPILAVLPDADKTGQIRALSNYIHRKIGYDARGMWLAERVWEPHMARSIAEAGISHVVVDDFHFKMAGLHDDELDGYYLTEEQNRVVRMFPGSERLRYLIPFHQPEETLEHLSGFRSTERNRLVVMADDGEKFGVWPETFHSVYEEGWLERLFSLIEQNSAWLETTTFSEYLSKEPPRGRIYLPSASYMEMGEWTLPTRAMKEYEEALTKAKNSPDFGALRPFIKGGIWRNFLAKYPESNHLHKRMMMVSRKVHDVLDNKNGQKQGQTLSRMLDHLYQSQCNDAYWHGVFGGLYLPHLRSALYEQLIQAEYFADAMRWQEPGAATRKQKGTQRGTGTGNNNEISWLEIERGDFDLDGGEEVMMNSEFMNLFIDPEEGGRITELDWKPRPFNLMNTLTRRPEGYHDKILRMAAGNASGPDGGTKTIHDRLAVKEEGLQHHLSYDWYTRGSLLDHFLGPDADLSSFMKSTCPETRDFVTSPYAVACRQSKTRAIVTMERTGNVAGRGVKVTKELTLRSAVAEVCIIYTIKNLGSDVLNTSFGSEFNFTLLAGNSHDRYYDIPGHILEKRNLASIGETENVGQVSLVDEWQNLSVTLTFSKPALLWRAPVETVSQSEAGFERVFQSSMVMPVWNISLQPKASWESRIAITIHNAARNH